MKTRLPLLALALSAALCGATRAADAPPAQSNGPEAEASLYGQSVSLPRQAAVCAERIADYGPRFKKFYDAWSAENATHIVNGGKFIHEQARVGGVDADASMAKLADADAERLRKISLEMLAKHCQLMIESMAPPSVN